MFKDLEYRYKKLSDEHQKESQVLAKDLKMNSNLNKQLNDRENKNEAIPLINSLLEVSLKDQVTTFEKNSKRKKINDSNEAPNLQNILRLKEMQIMSLINQMEKIEEKDSEALRRHIQNKKEKNKDSKVKLLQERTKDSNFNKNKILLFN